MSWTCFNINSSAYLIGRSLALSSPPTIGHNFESATQGHNREFFGLGINGVEHNIGGDIDNFSGDIRGSDIHSGDGVFEKGKLHLIYSLAVALLLRRHPL
jgi:hypothetical protein